MARTEAQSLFGGLFYAWCSHASRVLGWVVHVGCSGVLLERGVGLHSLVVLLALQTLQPEIEQTCGSSAQPCDQPCSSKPQEQSTDSS